MDSTAPAPTPVAAKLEASRRNLLDTTRRNRLINYRSSRTAGAEIIGEDPAEVFRLLVTEGRALTFTGKPDPKPKEQLTVTPAGQQTLSIDDYGDPAALQDLREKAELELNSYLGYEQAPVDQADLFLNCPDFESKLKIRLLKTLRDARTIIEESGVNVLFLALGMLEWREREDANLVRRAPLVLVPVALEQKQEKFRVRWDGGEIGCNLSLIALMRQEFGLTVPDFTNGQEMDVRDYFNVVERAIRSQSDWKVDRQGVALGFFSYAKFLMYADLEIGKWPEDRAPINHPVLSSLLETGFSPAVPALPEGEPVDAHRPIESCNEVTSIDGSQTLALMQAAQGDTMVIQGPPGTGKSQTITNLLADAIARGKRVLFVAEKLAALDVVARKMEEVGLRDACLELHSHKANKGAFYRELARVLELGPPKADDLALQMERLEQERSALNAYCEAVNQPFETRGISPRACMGRLIQLGPEPENGQMPPFDMMRGWSLRDFELNKGVVRELQSLVAADGSPATNPFYGSELTLLMPSDRDRILRDGAITKEAIAKAKELSTALAGYLSVPPPTRLPEVANLAAIAKRAAEAPPMDGVAVKVESWTQHEAELRTLLEAGMRLKTTLEEFSTRVRADAWREPVGEAELTLKTKGGKWWSFLSGAVRNSRTKTDSLAQQPLTSDRERLELLGAIRTVQEARAQIQQGEPSASRLFGVQWQGEQSDWTALQQLLDWVVALHKSVSKGEIPKGLLDFLEGNHTSDGLSGRAEEALQAAQHAAALLTSLIDVLKISPTGAQAKLGDFDTTDRTLQGWLDEPQKLQRMIAFNVAKQQAAEKGMTPIADLATHWPDAGKHLESAYERCWYEGVLREGLPTRSQLAGFDRERHESMVADFRKLDSLLLRHNQIRIQRAHAQRVPTMLEIGNLGWLNREIKKKRSQAPIRQAMSTAGAAIQDIKPVFMMSPLSVAMYLPPDGPTFDMVVFDEASQVKPEDSFGAILRGAQAIVVGDSRQMPPTSFFDRLTSEIDEEDEEQAAHNVTKDMESILALMDSRLPPRSPARQGLRWHYRSRHHSLITPANALSYEHRLFIFPNPEPSSQEMGLRLHYNPKTVYGRGTSRQNPLEAQEVIQAVQAHARDHPEESLMVVAFSAAQQRAIQDELDRVSPGDPALLEFMTRHPVERLDVKNLENVQGDERDVVFISIGYGKDENGYAAMSFGPLLLDGGERRLNVLITRARRRCEVFSNITAADIRLGESQSVGLRHLKTFLHYAQTGQMDQALPTGLEPMSPFEEVVLARLRDLGYEVDTQVGSAGFFIDLAIRNPDQPGAYLIGIECDGAQYHSSKTARDRDKLRQSVLEDRGWKLHRIWSTDWWQDPESALKRCVAAIEAAKVRSTPIPPPDPLTHPAVERESRHPADNQAIPPYECAHLVVSYDPSALLHAPVSHLGELACRVAAVEGPVHIDDVVKRIREACGATKASARMKEAVMAGVVSACRAGRLVLNDPFISLPNAPVKLRSRANLAGKSLELVSDEEIGLALEHVASRAYGINETDLASQAARLLGFKQTTAPMQTRLLRIIEELVQGGHLTKEGDTVLPRSKG